MVASPPAATPLSKAFGNLQRAAFIPCQILPTRWLSPTRRSGERWRPVGGR
ncbi:hypothetical protein ACLK17_25805 [Escherichia coli]